MQWYQHSFFPLLPCIGDPKKVESELQGATGGVEGDPVLLTAGEDGKCLGDDNSLSIQRSSSVLQSIQRKQETKTLSKGISEVVRRATVHGREYQQWSGQVVVFWAFSTSEDIIIA